jgi:hypothetical protein
LVNTYELSKKWTLSSVFVFSSGNRVTLPTNLTLLDQQLIAQGVPPEQLMQMQEGMPPEMMGMAPGMEGMPPQMAGGAPGELGSLPPEILQALMAQEGMGGMTPGLSSQGFVNTPITGPAPQIPEAVSGSLASLPPEILQALLAQQ